MSILKDIYGIEETDGASATLLTIPIEKYFSFDFNDMVKENNRNSSVLWNFGDPSSEDNEVMCSSLTKSVVSHIFKYQGLYTVTNVSNINGVIFQSQEKILIESP